MSDTLRIGHLTSDGFLDLIQNFVASPVSPLYTARASSR
jgi:hypothetical protein